MRVRFPPPAPEIHFRHLTYKKMLNVYLCLCKYKIYPVLRFSFPSWSCGFDSRRPLHLKLRLDNLARLCLRSHRHEIIESLHLCGHGFCGPRTYRTTSQGTPDLLPRQRACCAVSGAKPGQKPHPSSRNPTESHGSRNVQKLAWLAIRRYSSAAMLSKPSKSQNRSLLTNEISCFDIIECHLQSKNRPVRGKKTGHYV
jgi:hypothetical protein